MRALSELNLYFRALGFIRVCLRQVSGVIIGLFRDCDKGFLSEEWDVEIVSLGLRPLWF